VCGKSGDMIWNSVPLMTGFDFLIIAVTSYGIWRCRSIDPSRGPSSSRIGRLLITLGLLVVYLFYLADLVSMHVLRVITSTQEAMAFMGGLQRNLRSPVVLFAMVVISAGIVEVLRERQKREARVRRLVDFNIIGVFIWGPDGQIIDANEAFLRIVGYSRDDLASGPCWRELTPTQ
jgi:PAS domain-containing protein